MTPLGLIADIVTLLGFTFTCWQLISLKRIIKRKKEEAKKEQVNQMCLASVSEAISLIELILEYLINSEYRLALLKAEELNKLLLAIRNDDFVKNYTRENFRELLDNFTQRLIALRESICENGAYDSRFFMRNLQFIHDNLKLVQQKLKTK